MKFIKKVNSQQKKDLLSNKKRKHRKMKMGFFGRFAKKKSDLQKEMHRKKKLIVLQKKFDY